MKRVTIVGTFREVAEQIEAYNLKGYKIVRCVVTRGNYNEPDFWVYIMEGN